MRACTRIQRKYTHALKCVLRYQKQRHTSIQPSIHPSIYLSEHGQVNTRLWVYIYIYILYTYMHIPAYTAIFWVTVMMLVWGSTMDVFLTSLVPNGKCSLTCFNPGLSLKRSSPSRSFQCRAEGVLVVVRATLGLSALLPKGRERQGCFKPEMAFKSYTR